MRARRVVVGVVVAAVGVLGLLPASASAAEADTTPPVLRSVSMGPATVRPGGTLTVTLDASDDTALASMGVIAYEVTSGRSIRIDGTPRTPLQLPVTSAMADGRYAIHSVFLVDTAGNLASYERTGRLVTSPPATSSTHTVDLTGPGFVIGGASDLSPPVLDAFSMTSAATAAGRPSTLSWRVHDTASAVARLTTRWTSADSGETVEVDHATPLTGTGTDVLPYAGRWRLEWVAVADARGNTAFYLPDGTVDTDGPYGPTHALDLASIGLTLAPAAPLAEVRSRPGRLTVRLSAAAPLPRVVSGYRVTARPSGVSKVVPLRATLPEGWMTADLTGLPNGVTQTVEVTALSAWGESAVTRRAGRPVLSSNVQGVADLTGDGRADVIAQRERGTSTDDRPYRYAGTGSGLRAAAVFRAGNWSPCDHIGPFVTAGGASEPLCQSDDLMAMGRLADSRLGSRGWSGLRFVDGGFDLNGDRTADVIAVDPTGGLRLYAQTSKGALVAWPRIGTGWQSMISVISAGDLNGDRRNDIAAVDSAGRLWLYPGNGKGGVTARRQIGSGWQAMGALLPLRDFTGDGKADLGGITPGGDLRLYPGTGTGGVRGAVVIGRGWDRYL